MSLKEFGDSMGMPYDTVKKNAQRKKIIKGTDGKIDTELPINKMFFDAQMILLGTKTAKKEVHRDGGVSISREKKASTEKPTGLTANQKQYTDLDLRMRIANAESKEREAQLKNITLERLAGNSLPIDIVDRIMVINFQAIIKNFEASLENMAFITTEVLGGTRKDSADIVKKLRVELNTVVQKTKSDIAHEMESEIKVAIESRTQGQRK